MTKKIDTNFDYNQEIKNVKQSMMLWVRMD